MTHRCPRCAAELPEDAVWVCPTCDYTLRTPVVSKVGILVAFLGLVLVGGYVIGPENLGLSSGIMPTQLADFLLANFALVVAGTFALGLFLILVGALFVRAERNKFAPSA